MNPIFKIFFLLVGSKWGWIPKVSFLGCLQVPNWGFLWCPQTCVFYVDKSNACDVEKVKTEPEQIEDKEFKEDKKH